MEKEGIESTFIQDFLSKMLRTFRDLREKRGLTLSDLSLALKKNYGLEISSNMLGKIERNASRIQIELVLALLHFYNLQLSDIDPGFEKKEIKNTRIGREEVDPEEILRLCHINPDIHYILQICKRFATDTDFTNHIRTTIKTSLPILFRKAPEGNLWKAASPLKNQPGANPIEDGKPRKVRMDQNDG